MEPKRQESPLARNTTLAVRSYLGTLGVALALVGIYYLLAHFQIIAPPGSTLSKGNWFLIEEEVWVTENTEWRPTLHLGILGLLLAAPFLQGCRLKRGLRGWKINRVLLLISMVFVCLAPVSIGLWFLYGMPDVKTAWGAWEE